MTKTKWHVMLDEGSQRKLITQMKTIRVQPQ